MKTFAKRLWNEPVLFATALGTVAATVPDLPGPKWVWGIAVAVSGLGARQLVDGPIAKAAKG